MSKSSRTRSRECISSSVRSSDANGSVKSMGPPPTDDVAVYRNILSRARRSVDFQPPHEAVASSPDRSVLPPRDTPLTWKNPLKRDMQCNSYVVGLVRLAVVEAILLAAISCCFQFSDAVVRTKFPHRVRVEPSQASTLTLLDQLIEYRPDVEVGSSQLGQLAPTFRRRAPLAGAKAEATASAASALLTFILGHRHPFPEARV
jgi:hypothetical protein